MSNTSTTVAAIVALSIPDSQKAVLLAELAKAQGQHLRDVEDLLAQAGAAKAEAECRFCGAATGGGTTCLACDKAEALARAEEFWGPLVPLRTLRTEAFRTLRTEASAKAAKAPSKAPSKAKAANADSPARQLAKVLHAAEKPATATAPAEDLCHGAAWEAAKKAKAAGKSDRAVVMAARKAAKA